MGTVLIVDDIADYLRSLERALADSWCVICASTVEDAKNVLLRESVNVALIDMRLSEDDPANRDGLLLLEWIREHRPGTPVVMMSAYRDFDSAVDALNAGADRFLRKPVDLRELRSVLASAVERV
jgi:DNA-binding NtrC family response regulator